MSEESEENDTRVLFLPKYFLLGEARVLETWKIGLKILFLKWWLLSFSPSLPLLVPSAVKNIHISPNGATDSLMVNWTPGGGDVDSYTVTAFRQNQQVESQTIPKQVSEHTFHRLEAGEQYRVVVASVSGSLKNQVEAVGRTGECSPGQGPPCRMKHLQIQKPNLPNLKSSEFTRLMCEPFSPFLCIFSYQ